MHLFLRRFPALGRLQLFALLCAMMAGIQSLHAGTIIVTTTADSGPGSLRAAIAAASDGDTIQFDPGLNGQSITLTSGGFVIDKNITIDGPGADQLAVTKSSGGPDFRIFNVLPLHTFIIEGLTIDGNGTQGAGIWIDRSQVTLDGCVVQGCQGDGGIRCYASSLEDSYLTVINSTIRNNQANVAGGGIYIQASVPTLAHVLVNITNSVVSNNTVGSSGNATGGGIWSDDGEVEITNSVVSNNVSGGNGPKFPFGSGGGIYNDGFMHITSSTVSGNATGIHGGGVHNVGFLTLTNCTVSGNTAMGVSDFHGWGEGAGINNGGSMTIANSTLSNNTSSRAGGAVANRGSLTIRNSTLSGNDGFKGGTIANYNSAIVQIGNTALKVNTSSPSISNISGTITSNGYNITNDNGGGFLTATGDQINTEPMLGPLQNNGGPTLTHELLTGSPAIDTGNPSTPPESNDQRGSPYVRVFNGRIDIGSFEVQPAPPTPTPSPTPTATATSTPTATATASPPATATPTPTPTPTATATPPPTPTPTSTPSSSPGRALNISTRMLVQAGDRVGIGGFIITGSTPKQVLVRGIGPSLAQFGVPDPLADPVLELHGPAGFFTIINDNWRDTQIPCELPPTNDLESAICATLDPGPYTAILKGNNDTSGVGLVEIYDLDQAAVSKLANISTRAFVSTGANVMIGGFILGGDEQSHIEIFGLGPSLQGSGLSGVLADPTLELRDSNGVLLASNDNCGAISSRPLDPAEACIDISLPPGAFTAILAGNNGGTGIGLVEIYHVP